jgi:ABC-type sugar transport system ATPase subunit
MAEQILTFENICKSFFGVPVLDDVSFTLPAEHILGLVGENGAGKTTLMNILGGVLPADKGKMLLKGEAYAPTSPADATGSGVAFIHQELNLFTNLSVGDNVFIDCFPRMAGLGLIDKRRIKRQTREILQSVELDLSPDTLVEKLSPGERQLVEIAKALGTGAELVIFDEPTTSLTARETRRLFSLIETLRRRGKSIIYISHNLGDVLQLADDVVILRDGKVVDVGVKETFTVEKMISRMVGRDISQMYPPRSARPSDRAVLEVNGLSQSGIVKDINFVLHESEVLGLFGLMGSGRTELARILFGLDPFESGRIVANGVARDVITPSGSVERGMAFVTEDRHEEGLLLDASVLDNVALVSLPRYAGSYPPRLVRNKRIRGAAQRVADAMRLKAGSLESAGGGLVKNLSGGNQQKAVISKWLMAEPSLFIMDEPTRGIDVGAKYEMYNIINELAARGTGVLFISSELEELIGNCDRILVISNGQIQGRFAREEFDEQAILHAAFLGHAKHKPASHPGREDS